MVIRERFYLYQQYVDYLHRNAIIAVTVCVAAAAIYNHDKTTDARKAIASKTRCKPPGIISVIIAVYFATRVMINRIRQRKAAIKQHRNGVKQR